MAHTYRGIFVLVVVQTIIVAWVLRDRQSLTPSIALGLLIVVVWFFEMQSLSATARGLQSLEPSVNVGQILLTYGAFWGLQVGGASLMFASMRVHTLPVAFELLGCFVATGALVYCLRTCIEGFLPSSRVTRLAGRPWWDLPASCAGVSPSCGLFSILICKACGQF